MAKPDTDDGFVIKACELEAALDYADFTKYARTALRYLVAQTFGRKSRPDYAILSPTEIAKRAGWARQNAHQGIKELVSSNAIVPIPEVQNGYRFVSDYETWVKPGVPGPCNWRISPHQVADCKDAPAYARIFLSGHPKPNPVIHRHDKAVMDRHDEPSSIPMTPTPGSVIDPHDARHGSTLRAVMPINDKSASPPAPPLIGAEFQSSENQIPPSAPHDEKLSAGGGEGERAREVVARSRAEAERIHAVESSCGSDGTLPGPHQPDADELSRARRFVEAQFPNNAYNLARAMDQHARQYPSGWWVLAWKRAKLFESSNGRVRSFNLILNWMGEWLDRGGPTSGPWDDYADDMSRVMRTVAAVDADGKTSFQQRRSAELAELTEGFCLPPRRGPSDGVQ